MVPKQVKNMPDTAAYSLTATEDQHVVKVISIIC